MNGESRSLGKQKKWEGGALSSQPLLRMAQMELRLCLVGGQEVPS